MLGHDHNIRFDRQPTGQAVMEMLEDGVAAVARAYQDPRAKRTGGKVTLVIDITPDADGLGHNFELSSKLTLPALEKALTKAFIGSDPEGRLEAVPYDPRQMRLWGKPTTEMTNLRTGEIVGGDTPSAE